MNRSAPDLRHPSPQRGRASPAWLLAALAIGPAAWALQLETGYGLASYACFPHNAPLGRTPPPGWEHETLLLGGLQALCLLLCLAGLGVSLAHWRRTRAEKPGSARDLLHVGEGRTRFLAACGLLVSVGFAVAILFDTAVVLGTPACWSFPG